MGDWTALEDRVLRSQSGSSLAEPVTYTPQGGVATTTTPDGRPLRGIFEADPIELDPETQVMVRSRSPILQMRLADLPGGVANQGDQAVVRGSAYEVRDVEDNGLDVTLHLRRAP
jgi:hypothetical protein